ncbi:MAG: type II secretion system F family protein [Planctomycetales bacterium]
MISFPAPESSSSGKVSSPNLDVESWDRIAELVRARQPLEAGLKIVAQELPSGKQRRELLKLVRELEQGKSPAELCEDTGRSSELRQLLKAGVETGQLGALLQDYVEDAMQARELRWQVRFFMLYSLGLVTLALSVNAFLLTYLNDLGGKLARDFEISSPVPVFTTSAVFWAGWGVACLPVLVVLFGWLASKILPLRIWGLFYHIPLLGAIFRWEGFARGCRILALMLQASCPLPKGMLIAGRGVRQPLAAHSFQRLGALVENGAPLEDAALTIHTLPPSLREVFIQLRDGESLREMLRGLADLYTRRAQELIRWFLIFWEPAVLLVCATCIMIAYMGIMYNLTTLLRQLM